MRRMWIGFIAVVLVAGGGNRFPSVVGVFVMGLGAITLGVLISSGTAAVEDATRRIRALWGLQSELMEMEHDNKAFGFAAMRVRQVLLRSDMALVRGAMNEDSE